MTNHIDLGTVLRQTVSANLYSNLVTRPTGAAVRTQIETLLRASDVEGGGGGALTIIDFSHVSMIDFSCADEIIAKLLLRHPAEREGYFVLRGVTEGHWDAIETVLERHGLAVLIERESGVELAGVVDDAERRAFDALKRRGRAECWQLAHDVGEAEPRMRGVVENMWRRRLVMRAGDSFMPVGQLA